MKVPKKIENLLLVLPGSLYSIETHNANLSDFLVPDLNISMSSRINSCVKITLNIARNSVLPNCAILNDSRKNNAKWWIITSQSE